MREFKSPLAHHKTPAQQGSFHVRDPLLLPVFYRSGLRRVDTVCVPFAVAHTQRYLGRGSSNPDVRMSASELLASPASAIIPFVRTLLRELSTVRQPSAAQPTLRYNSNEQYCEVHEDGTWVPSWESIAIASTKKCDIETGEDQKGT